MKHKFLIGLYAIAFLGLSDIPSQHFRAQSAPRRIQIAAKRFAYTPNEITLKLGEPVVLVLSSGDVDHGLKFKELNLAVAVKKGMANEVAFTPAKVGTFVGQCSVFCGSGHGSMKMTLHVTE